MLVHLAVTNLGVIDSAEIDPSRGLTVITGETGTGKTLLLGGIRQLLGESGDPGLVGPTGTETTIDGLFEGVDGEVGVTRVIPSVGRSRTRINGAVVSANSATETLGAFVEVIGQHDQLSLRRTDHLRRIIDSALDDQGKSAISEYQTAWDTYHTSLERQQSLGGDLTTLSRELDLARHQASEIEGAGLTVDLDDRLERNVSRLRNIEEIRENLAASIELADQMSDLSGEMVARLRKVLAYDPGLEDLSSGAEGLAADAQDLVTQTRRSLDEQASDPGSLEELESRLTAIGDLKRKYGKTLEEVIAFGVDIAGRAAELESLLEESDSIEAKVAADRAALIHRATLLSRMRKATCERLSTAMSAHLTDLGMGTTSVHLEITPVEPASSGADRVDLLFASDDRLEPRPVSEVASGGELSRLVLAFRLAISWPATRTLVFDEIDSGIGGQTALAMGEKLAALATTTQVLCVTHLPQVAARADRHYVVSRGSEGIASVRLVEGEDRVEVIATMMSGAGSEAGLTAAEELLALH